MNGPCSTIRPLSSTKTESLVFVSAFSSERLLSRLIVRCVVKHPLVHNGGETVGDD